MQAARAKHALETIATEARLPWSFRVARGTVCTELLLEASHADLIGLGHRGWSLIGTGRIGTTTETVISQADTPVLLLGRKLRLGQSVIALYDGSDAAHSALRLATQIAHDGTTPLVVVLPTTGDHADTLRREAQSEIENLGIDRSVRYRTIVRRDVALLRGLTHEEDAGILILPIAGIFEQGLKNLLTHLECPVLAVKR